MFQNYFKSAFRNLIRNKQFTFINIAGLAIGIAVFLFIVQYVAFEWNANRFNKNYSELYRVNYQYKEGNTDYYLAPGLAPAAKQQIPSIENYVRVADGIASGVLSYKGNNSSDNKTFRENNMMYVDGNFLNVFSFPIVAGTNSLIDSKTLALSETISQKIFGTTDVIGKQIKVSNQFGNTVYTIKAVYKLPEESDIKGDVLLSLQTLESAANRDGNDWADPNGVQSGFVNIYLQLKKNSNAASVSKEATAFVHSVNPQAKNDKIILQPFSELHLAPSFDYPFQTFGSLLLVAVFSGVAVLILLIAWVNYINLSTAQALNRAKEVGVRKVLGANRIQLMFQYLTETFILTLSSAVIAVLLVNVFQNMFNEFTGKQLSLSVLNNGWFWFSSVLLIAVGSLLSGGFVSFALTSFKPVSTLRGKIQATSKRFSLRKGLVVFQFTISIVFIIATVVLYKQLKFMQTENLGMNLNELLVIQGPTVTSNGQSQKNASFKNALAQLSFVKKYAASNDVPGVGYNFSTENITQQNSPQKGDEKKSYSMFISDDRFFDTYGIQFSQGKTFSQDDVQESWNKIQKVIINEKAAQSLGFNTKENLIGKKIVWEKPYEIIGVVKDYHHLSFREPIKPTIYLASASSGYYTIQTDTRNMQSKINEIKNIYASTFPGNPFEYFFANEKYDQQYFEEQKLGNVFIASAFVAALIACLGLFGLAAFTARQRVKEIGIRKVLGAGVADITTLLSKDFIVLVIISMVIASPIAWWAMNKWLQDFAYRTNISWWVFILAGIIAVTIALATIGFQSIKAAIANPVKSLRSE
ncbi:MAG TPA: ABC transporter permease [Puia sp.]|nr:ABC transporter permease [Puia sp.]